VDEIGGERPAQAACLWAFETSVAYDILSLTTDDVTEGSAAFLERRKPDFKGR
jgi:1,4-dihydroxy-2-naphthoyl-CoA synthase